MGNLEVVVEPKTQAEWGDILLIEIQDPARVTKLPTHGPKRIVMVGSVDARKQFGNQLSQSMSRHRLSHRKLGGLTVATVEFWWYGENEMSLRLGGEGYPKRPLNKFVNLTANLPVGVDARKIRNQKAWWRSHDDRPFGWPFPEWPVVIDSPSVFLKGDTIKRHLTEKEACQLLDIPEIWGSKIVRNIWSWNHGHVLPLRLQVEFLLKAIDWLSSRQDQSQEFKVMPPKPSDETTLLLLQTKQAQQIGETGLFRLSHFTWVWEPQNVNEVSLATKADDAAINRDIWAVGGKAPGLEKKREVIRKCLHRVWYANLRREANAFLCQRKSTVLVEDYAVDLNAVVECLEKINKLIMVGVVGWKSVVFLEVARVLAWRSKGRCKSLSHQLANETATSKRSTGSGSMDERQT